MVRILTMVLAEHKAKHTHIYLSIYLSIYIYLSILLLSNYYSLKGILILARVLFYL